MLSPMHLPVGSALVVVALSVLSCTFGACRGNGEVDAYTEVVSPEPAPWTSGSDVVTQPAKEGDGDTPSEARLKSSIRSLPDADVPTKPLDLGDWKTYPTVATSEAPTSRPLTDRSWALVSAEWGCVGRRSHGDPDEHRGLVLRIAQHYRTSPEEVMAYGILLNRDYPQRALLLGQLVADAVQLCH